MLVLPNMLVCFSSGWFGVEGVHDGVWDCRVSFTEKKERSVGSLISFEKTLLAIVILTKYRICPISMRITTVLSDIIGGYSVCAVLITASTRWTR
jgi:hypothetical protein